MIGAMRPVRNALVVTVCLSLCGGGPALAEACGPLTAIETFDTSFVAPDGSLCLAYLSPEGADGVSCHWTFPFRDAAAKAFATELWEMIAVCRPGVPGGEDQRVNHPDSFELLEWTGQGVTYRVSVKDKGGLSQTLVFLGYESGSGS